MQVEDYATYWTITDCSAEAEIKRDFGAEVIFNRLMLQEYTPLGQRVKSFVLEKEDAGNWEKIAEGTTVGYKRILRFPDVTASAIRIRFTDGKDIPLISKVGIYNAPKLIIPPSYSREKSGEITLTKSDDGLEIYYTLDDSDQSAESQKYSAPFKVEQAVT